MRVWHRRFPHHADDVRAAVYRHARYYIGLETIVLREGDSRMPHWQGKLFALMVRNGMHVTDLFRLPSNQVVEIGRRVSI